MTTCGEMMTKNPSCCVPTDTIQQAAVMMKNENVGSIPVVESHDSKKLAGIITDRDIVLKVIAEGRDGQHQTIAEVMTRDPVTCKEQDSLDNALQAMARYQVRRIPIVNDRDEIIGIIAQADVAIKADQPHKTAEVVEEISRPDR